MKWAWVAAVAVVVTAACASSAQHAAEPGASANADGRSPLGRGDIATVELMLDPGVAGIPTLSAAAQRWGCDVDDDYYDGSDALVARCPDGDFGAVQEGRQLTLLCASMSQYQCSAYVLQMLDHR